MGLKSTNAHI